MIKVKYTHTEEGKDVLNILENIISTKGMEVYKCNLCDYLFAGQPELVNEEKPVCGICQMEIDAENYIPGEEK